MITTSDRSDGVPAPAQEVEIRVGERSAYNGLNADGLTCRRRDSTSSNTVRDTNTAVKTLDSRPMVSVVAKPRIGPVPN